MTPEQFKSIREEHLGLSQDRLAQVLGLSSKQVVSNIETGLRNPSQLTIAFMSLLSVMPSKKALDLAMLVRFHVDKEKWSAKRKVK